MNVVKRVCLACLLLLAGLLIVLSFLAPDDPPAWREPGPEIDNGGWIERRSR